MNKMRAVTATASLAVAATVLVGCSTDTTASGQSGLTALDASGSPLPTGVPSVAPGPTSTSTKKSGGGTGGGNPHGGTTTAGGTSTATVTASAGTPTKGGTHLISDYKIVITGSCYWALDRDNELLVGTHFKITHSGLLRATGVPFVMTDDKDHDSTTSTSAPLNTEFAAAIGADGGSVLRYPGRKVEVTGRINPTSGDSNAGNNSASVKIKVPLLGLPISTTPVAIPCDD